MFQTTDNHNFDYYASCFDCPLVKELSSFKTSNVIVKFSTIRSPNFDRIHLRNTVLLLNLKLIT